VTGERARIPALDGVRALAVCAVLVFHAKNSLLPGGFLGVDVFFVLSGFLIASILLHDVEQAGRINFGRFLLGRARRLLPCLLLVLAVTAGLASTVAQDSAERVREDTLAALTYTTNWWYVAHEQSYFDVTGRPPLLQHLWSLAVEEQFYLIFPALLLLVWRRWGTRGVGWIAFAGAVTSTVLMAALSVADGTGARIESSATSRLYFGTDTHGMGLLIGVALACAARIPAARTPAWPSRITNGAVGWLSLMGLASAFLCLHPDSAILYRGGFLLVAGLTALVITCGSRPGLGLRTLLSLPLLSYLGSRSYGLYLWHWPVFMVIRPGIDTSMTGVPNALVRFAVTVVLAELSYRFVERPIRAGALGRIARRWTAAGPTVLLGRTALTMTGAAIVVVPLTFALVNANEQTVQTALRGRQGIGDGLLPTRPPSSPVSDPSSSPGPTGGPAIQSDLAAAPITAVGDSVMLNAAHALEQDFPRITVDARISRQPLAIFDRVRQRKAAGELGPVVVIHAGTNGVARFSDLVTLLGQLADRARVVLVNTHVPDDWGTASNTNISSVAKRYKNVRVVDWSKLATDHPDWLYADGTHTTPNGSTHYAAAIRAALEG